MRNIYYGKWLASVWRSNRSGWRECIWNHGAHLVVNENIIFSWERTNYYKLRSNVINHPSPTTESSNPTRRFITAGPLLSQLMHPRKKRGIAVVFPSSSSRYLPTAVAQCVVPSDLRSVAHCKSTFWSFRQLALSSSRHSLHCVGPAAVGKKRCYDYLLMVYASKGLMMMMMIMMRTRMRRRIRIRIRI